MLPHNADAVFNFDVTVCSSGCDYTAFSTAENALDNAGDIRDTGSVKSGAWDAQSGSIADATAVTWDSGASTGTLHHMTDAGAVGEYLVTVTTGVLDDNDIISDGTNTITVAGAPDSVSINMNCGANETITDQLVIGGFTTDSDNTVTVSVLEAFRHNGTVSTGCRINYSSAGDVVSIVDSNVTVEWLIISEGWNNNTNSLECVFFGNADTNNTLSHTIVPNCANSGAGRGDSAVYVVACTSTCTQYIINNIVYGAQTDAIDLNVTFGITLTAVNNTVYGGSQYGHKCAPNGTCVIKNGLSCGNTSGDYSGNIDTNITNGACDTTGTLDSLVAADTFVSITGGSENLHLKSGSGAIDQGTDLVNTPTGVKYDIDNRDRDAQGDVWDMGADEFVVSATTAAVGQPRVLRFGTLILLFGTLIMF